LSNVKQIH